MSKYHVIKKWYERPLLCILGAHKNRPHPSDFTVNVCDRCGMEDGW